MKKILKIFLILIIVLITGVILFGYIKNETLPKGINPDQADILANKVLLALNKKAYDDTNIIEWSFKGIHRYKWYKKDHKVEVYWGKNKVLLYTKPYDKSILYIDGKETNNAELINKAIDYFNNDSFWLVAPYKIFDPGTKRSIVKYENKDALLITYTSGGSTPGDSYLWILDDDYIPTSYKMWAEIIPIGGLEVSWDNWITVESGCKLPTNHTIKAVGMGIEMGTVKAYN